MRVKNVIVLSIVFTAVSISVLLLNRPEKQQGNKVIVTPEDVAKKAVEQPQESSVQSGATGQGAMESPQVIAGTNQGAEITPTVGETTSGQSDAARHLALGVEYYKNNDLSKSLRHLQEALRIEPDNKDAQHLISKISREAKVEEGFRNKEGSHFNVRYEGGENSVAGYLVAIILEEAYQKIGSDMGFYPDDPITTILYSLEQFRDVTKAPSWSGAIYDGKIRIPVGGVRERTDVLERVIFHEYTHAVIHRMGGGRVPTWLNEGVAQHEEGFMNDREGIFKYLAAAQNLIPLNYLEGSFMGMNQEQASMAYAEGLSAVKYIIDEYGMGMLARLISSYKDGRDSEAAIKDTFHMTYKEFQGGWIRSLKRRYGN